MKTLAAVKYALPLVGALLLYGCEIVDTGPTRIGGVSCGWNMGTPGTPEYNRCTSRNADEGVFPARRPSGAVGF